MKISTRSRYAVRASLCLAMHHGDSPVPLSRICNDQKISIKYLENIMRLLVKAGIAEGTKGKGGGFVLKKRPDQIKMYDIILAAEKNLTPVMCVTNPGQCAREKNCAANKLWTGFNDSITEYFNSIKLSDMVKIQRKQKTQFCEGGKS
jgi:Rrf2 family protein